MKRKNSLKDTRGGKHGITAFYIETLALMLIFMAVILVLLKVFALAAGNSSRAGALTCAVRLAENAAEAVAAAEDEEGLHTLLERAGNGAVSRQPEGDTVLFRAFYDEERNPSPEGNFRVDVTWEPQEDGKLVKSGITVYWNGEEIYALDTAVYTGR